MPSAALPGYVATARRHIPGFNQRNGRLAYGRLIGIAYGRLIGIAYGLSAGELRAVGLGSVGNELLQRKLKS